MFVVKDIRKQAERDAFVFDPPLLASQNGQAHFLD
jgi:hypothetical protein